jgi:hypothetical protein
MKTLKKEYQPGGSKRQFILDKAVEYLTSPKYGTQNYKHDYLVNVIGLSETEYLECLNNASMGAVVESAWN